ncbi:MAG: hypothetical protein ABSD29_07720 [Verrucomicrobiota bacterium]|jgi:hypothetical protein
MPPTNQKAQSKIAAKQLQLRNKLWPNIGDDKLWLRKVRTGFTTVPRTMPLLMEIMDSLSKGKPVSSAYFDLWCRAYDECFVTLNKPREMAFHAGYSGQRAEQTWTDRIRILVKLGFIEVKPGPSGELSYAIILNPYQIIKFHYKKKTPGMREDLFNALLQRANEIGANDLDD